MLFFKCIFDSFLVFFFFFLFFAIKCVVVACFYYCRNFPLLMHLKVFFGNFLFTVVKNVMLASFSVELSYSFCRDSFQLDEMLTSTNTTNIAATTNSGNSQSYVYQTRIKIKVPKKTVYFHCISYMYIQV